MTAANENFNSIADAINAIHQARSRVQKDQATNDEVKRALVCVDELELRTFEDANSLLALSCLVLEGAVIQLGGTEEDAGVVEIGVTYLYIHRAIRHLEAFVKTYHVSNGASIN